MGEREGGHVTDAPIAATHRLLPRYQASSTVARLHREAQIDVAIDDRS